MSQPCRWRASEDNPHGSGAGMHHAPPLSQRPSSRVKTPAIRGFLTRDNVILTCPAAQSGENGLITDAHLALSHMYRMRRLATTASAGSTQAAIMPRYGQDR